MVIPTLLKSSFTFASVSGDALIPQMQVTDSLMSAAMLGIALKREVSGWRYASISSSVTPVANEITTCFSGESTGFSSFKIVLTRSEEHTSELQSRENLVCRLLLEKKKKIKLKNQSLYTLKII